MFIPHYCLLSFDASHYVLLVAPLPLSLRSFTPYSLRSYCASSLCSSLLTRTVCSLYAPRFARHVFLRSFAHTMCSLTRYITPHYVLRIFTAFIFARSLFAALIVRYLLSLRSSYMSCRCAHSMYSSLHYVLRSLCSLRVLSLRSNYLLVHVSLRSTVLYVRLLTYRCALLFVRSSSVRSLTCLAALVCSLASLSRCARCLVCIRCAHQTRLTRACALVELRSACYF
jgi:hypothetical protein